LIIIILMVIITERGWYDDADDRYDDDEYDSIVDCSSWSNEHCDIISFNSYN